MHLWCVGRGFRNIRNQGRLNVLTFGTLSGEKKLQNFPLRIRRKHPALWLHGPTFCGPRKNSETQNPRCKKGSSNLRLVSLAFAGRWTQRWVNRKGQESVSRFVRAYVGKSNYCAKWTMDDKDCYSVEATIVVANYIVGMRELISMLKYTNLHKFTVLTSSVVGISGDFPSPKKNCQCFNFNHLWTNDCHGFSDHPWTPKPWKMKVWNPQYMGYNP